MTQSNRLSNCSHTIVTPDEESTRALLFIKYTAIIVQGYLVNLSSKRDTNQKQRQRQRQRAYDIMEEVKELTELLHDLLFDLNICGMEGLSVQKSIVVLCETYWNGNFINRNDYVASVIPLLVVRTLDRNATKADIRRLWNMREAMKLLSFQEESIAYLRSLVVRTVGSGLFLKNAEGRKMLCFFFQLDCGLVKHVHEAIKAQIPLAKKPELLFYGEIYCRAWKEALASGQEEEGRFHGDDDSGEEDDSYARPNLQDTIEDALQELMNASVHVALPHMATSLRTVLEPLLSQKKNPEVDLLLYKMYTPFLWRSLSAANPLVRVNASSALFKTFPLRDPNAGKLHLKDVHAKTVESLMKLLHDEDHKVRVAGCDATIQILGFFWDSLLSTHIRSLLNEIVMKHGYDATSSAVRAQAVNGINQLLDAKASHGVLRQLLPYLGDLIHDRVEKVRLATVKLLLKLKKTKGFKFFHTVPKEHILARLAAEGEGVITPTGPVASALSDLLSNSYYPRKVEVSEVVRRTVGFLEENPKAARVFYSNVAYHFEIKWVCKLIKLLLRCIKIGVARELQKKEEGCDEGEVSDYGDLSSTITASNTGLMAEMGATLLILLNSISADLDCAENEKCLHYIQDDLHSNDITGICEYFESRFDHYDDGNVGNESSANDCHRICASLLSCSGFTNLANREDLCKQLSNRLKAYTVMNTDERRKINIVPYLAVYCSWGMHQDVAQSLGQSIASAFSDDETFDITLSSPVSSPSRRKKRKQADTSDTKNGDSIVPKLPCDVSVQLIGKILRGRDPCSVIIRKALLSSEESSSLIADALEKATIAAEQIISGPPSSALNDGTTIELILSACDSFGRLTVHKEAYKDSILTMTPEASNLLRWLTKRAVPSIVSKNHAIQTSSPFQALNLSRISAIGIRESISPTPLSPLVMAPPRRKSNLDSSFATMENEGGRQFVVDSESPHSCMMVVTLIKSALAVFGEWLALGGQGADEIVKSVKDWAAVFDCNFTDIDAKRELFPAYCRFGAIVASNHSNYDLLKDILSTINFEENTGYEECIEGAIKHLLSKKLTQSKNMNELVTLIIDILHFDENTKEVESFTDFVDGQTAGIRVAVQMLLASTSGIVSFATVLSKALMASTTSSSTISQHEKILVLFYTEHKEVKQYLKDCIFHQLGTDGKRFETIRQAFGERVC